tara:strand:+ start:1056 stop:1520 length:465 start_codon:yes stop_codon:yes gene_type:complete
MNFSFNKLNRNLNKIIKSSIFDIAKDSEKQSKKAIDSGLTPPLAKSTISIRRWKNKKGIASGTGTKPLKFTGALYNSIKATKEGLEMLKYGIYHNRKGGFKPKKIPTYKGMAEIGGITVPQRRFIIAKEQRKETVKRFKRRFMKNLIDRRFRMK